MILAVAQKLTAIVSAPCSSGSLKVAVSASIGISVFPEAGHTAQELLEKADAAMYAAKHKSNGPVFWTQIDAK